ncbi:MAG: hypothetical protein ACOCQD_05405 [archaeon]
MNKYLVIYSPNSGIAQLSNVGVIEAETKKEAKEKFISFSHLSFSIKPYLNVYDFEELPTEYGDVWVYFD